MADLYDPARHEPLLPSTWDPAAARDCVARIVAMAEGHFAAHGLWRAHPRDSRKQGSHYMLYAGASGVIWALHYLQQRGAVSLTHDYAPHLLPMLEPNREDFGDAARPPFGSFLMGDTGIRLVHRFVSGAVDGDPEMEALIRANRRHPAREFMWGSPGSLAAALFMHRHTGQPVWASLFRETAAQLRCELHWAQPQRCQVWTQDLYGESAVYLGAVHGFAGTAAPLLRGRDLLEPGQWAHWRECIANTVRQCAQHDGPLVNWQARLSSAKDVPGRVQYCHGAPGFVIALADWPGDELDDLLQGGAETVWRAGPLAKGPQLCHGTGGNGYALLAMWRRTGDPLWLDRARSFAMHAIAQFERELDEPGGPWYSLWTGHPGLAVYLWDCIEGAGGFPTVDVFFA